MENPPETPPLPRRPGLIGISVLRTLRSMVVVIAIPVAYIAVRARAFRMSDARAFLMENAWLLAGVSVAILAWNYFSARYRAASKS